MARFLKVLTSAVFGVLTVPVDFYTCRRSSRANLDIRQFRIHIFRQKILRDIDMKIECRETGYPGDMSRHFDRVALHTSDRPFRSIFLKLSFGTPIFSFV